MHVGYEFYLKGKLAENLWHVFSTKNCRDTQFIHRDLRNLDLILAPIQAVER